MADLRIILSVIGRTTGATRALGSLGSALGGVASTAAGFAIGQGLAALPGLLTDAAKAAVEDEQATARLSQALANLGGDVAANTAAVNERIEAGQKLAYTDDEIRNSFQVLAAATGDSAKALERQKLAMDLARGAGISLEAATKLVSKSNEENVNAFRRLGIAVKDGATEAEVLAMVQAKFAGQADTYAQSSKGQMEAFSIAIDELKEGLGGALLPLIGQFGSLLSANMPTIQAVAKLLTEGIAAGADLAGKALGPVIAALQEFGSTALPVLQTFAGIVRQVFEGDLASAFQNWVALLSWVGQRLGDQLLVWGQQLVDWIAPMIGPILEQLGILAGQIGAWIVQVGLPLLAEKVKQWIPAFIDWLGEAVPAALVALGEFLTNFVNGIATNEGDISDQVDTSWVPALVDWITEKAIPALIENLPKIAAALMNFMLDLGEAIAKAMARIGAKFIAWMVDVVLPSIPPAMLRILTAIGEWITGTAAPWVGEQASLLGQSIVNGLISGINSLVELAKQTASDLAQSILDSLVDAIVPGSPSKVTTKYGEAVAQGLVVGMLRMQRPVEDAAATLAGGVIDNVNNALGALNTLAKATGGSQIKLLSGGLGGRSVPSGAGGLHLGNLPNIAGLGGTSITRTMGAATPAGEVANRTNQHRGAGTTPVPIPRATTQNFHAPINLTIQGGPADALNELSRLYGGAG